MDILKISLIFLLLLFPIAELGKFHLGLISFSINDLLMGSVVIAWIFKHKFSLQNVLLKEPMLVVFATFSTSLLLNIGWLELPDFFISLLYLIRLLLYASLYAIILSLDKKFIQKLKLFLIIPISLFLISGYIQFFLYQNLRNLYYLGWDEHLYRLFSTFLDPNFAGTFFVLTFIYLLYLVFSNLENRFLFISLSFLSIANFIAIFLTYSRSALIMLFVSLFTFLVLIRRKSLLVMVGVAIIIFLVISPKSFRTEGTNIFRIASSEARLDSARVAIEIFSKNPIFGVGFNAYRFAQHRYGYLAGGDWRLTHSGAGTDNSFLFILATTGLVGFAAYIYLIYKIIRMAIKKNNFIAKVLIASLAGLLINSLFINSLFFIYIMMWIWIMVAFTESS